MADKLKITLVQVDIFWEDIESNLNRYNNLLKQVHNPQLIIFPEMFASGFTMNKDIFSTDSNTQILKWLTANCRDFSCAIMVSTGFKDKEGTFNRCILCDKEGSMQVYNKKHLFSPGSESEFYQKGNKRTVFELDEWRIFPQICYDLRFPVWSRNDLNYDLIVNMANWPATRDEHWKSLLKARAIENQVYVAGVNRTGEDPNKIKYTGNSLVYAYDGSDILDTGNKTDVANSVILSKEKMLQYRKKLPFLNDIDRFSIEE